jgi:hypothetical protein
VCPSISPNIVSPILLFEAFFPKKLCQPAQLLVVGENAIGFPHLSGKNFCENAKGVCSSFTDEGPVSAAVASAVTFMVLIPNILAKKVPIGEFALPSRWALTDTASGPDDVSEEIFLLLDPLVPMLRVGMLFHQTPCPVGTIRWKFYCYHK